MVHASCVYALTIGLVLAFCLAGLYALSATGDIRRLPLTRTAIITIVVLYSLRALAGGISCIYEPGCNASHPSFPPLLHGATGWELKKEQRFVKSMLKSLFLLTRP